MLVLEMETLMPSGACRDQGAKPVERLGDGSE